MARGERGVRVTPSLEIVRVGINGWLEEAKERGPLDEGTVHALPAHPYVQSVFQEGEANARDLAQDGAEALHNSVTTVITEAGAAIRTQHDLESARSIEISASDRLRTLGPPPHSALLGQIILLGFSFLLECFLLFIAFQNLDFPEWAILGLVVLISGLLTWVIHWLYGWLGERWIATGENARQRRPLMFLAVAAGLLIVLILVSLTFLRAQDFRVAGLNIDRDSFKFWVLVALGGISGLATLTAAVAGINHARTAEYREAKHACENAQKEAVAADRAFHDATAARSKALLHLGTITQAYHGAISTVPNVVVMIANECLTSEGRGHTAQNNYVNERDDLAQSVKALIAQVSDAEADVKRLVEEHQHEAKALLERMRTGGEVPGAQGMVAANGSADA